MSVIWISVLIALAPGTLVFVYKLLNIAIGFSHIYHTHADLDIAVIEHDTANQKAKIKIAYAGSNPLIVRKIELKSALSVPSAKERFFAWFQLARGYITDDWEGLKTVLGQNFAIKEPVWVRKIVNSIQGILFSLLIISFLYNPFGWFLFFVGPYGNLRIVATDKNVITKESKTNANQVLPFLIKTSDEKEFLIRYKFSVKSRAFLPTTEAKYIIDSPAKSHWKLPRPGEFVLRGNVKLIIRTSGLWAAHRVNLGVKDFVLIPSQHN